MGDRSRQDELRALMKAAKEKRGRVGGSATLRKKRPRPPARPRHTQQQPPPSHQGKQPSLSRTTSTTATAPSSSEAEDSILQGGERLQSSRVQPTGIVEGDRQAEVPASDGVLPQGFFDDYNEDEESDGREPHGDTSSAAAGSVAARSGDDDAGGSSAAPDDKLIVGNAVQRGAEDTVTDVGTGGAAVPAGFFDDESRDRKARKVDVASDAALMKSELEAFAADIEEDMAAAAAAADADDDAAIDDENLEQQIAHHRALVRLARLKDMAETGPASITPSHADALPAAEVDVMDAKAIRAAIKQRKQQRLAVTRGDGGGGNGGISDDDDEDDLLDWRAKRS